MVACLLNCPAPFRLPLYTRRRQPPFANTLTLWHRAMQQQIAIAHFRKFVMSLWGVELLV